MKSVFQVRVRRGGRDAENGLSPYGLPEDLESACDEEGKEDQE